MDLLAYFLFFLLTLTNYVDSAEKKPLYASVRIYANLAEIISPLPAELPLEFTDEEWSDIRTDSITLVGSGVNVSSQTITEKKKSLNGANVHVRIPHSTGEKSTFLPATLVDEDRNLVKVTEKSELGAGPSFFIVGDNRDIIYSEELPKSKYYVNFVHTGGAAGKGGKGPQVSYLRSNLNWKTRYQLNMLDDNTPVLVGMADIRNDGKGAIEVDKAELLGGDINLKRHHDGSVHHRPSPGRSGGFSKAMSRSGSGSSSSAPPTVSEGEELAGLYVFTIDKPFSLEAKTNYLLSMFRERVTVDRYHSVSKYFHSGNSKGKTQRSYRLTSDRFLSAGNCIIREFDRLVGETNLPDLAAKDKVEFSVGEDSDVTYKENVTRVSVRDYNETTGLAKGEKYIERTESVYTIDVTFHNFKKKESVKIEYEERFHHETLTVEPPNKDVTKDGMTIKANVTVPSGQDKVLSYKVKLVQ